VFPIIPLARGPRARRTLIAAASKLFFRCEA
jgi:hypothetical protein